MRTRITSCMKYAECCLFYILYKILCQLEGIGFAYIQYAQVCLLESLDRRFGTYGKVEVDDRKLAGPLVHPFKYLRRDNMNAVKSKLVVYGRIKVGVIRLYFAGLLVSPSAQLVLFVEQQIAGCIPFAYQQGGQWIGIQVVLIQCFQVYIGNNVHIVYQKWFISL